jgi:hypothetical protein
VATQEIVRLRRRPLDRHASLSAQTAKMTRHMNLGGGNAAASSSRTPIPFHCAAPAAIAVLGHPPVTASIASLIFASA